jgi:hypothetical protein
LAEAEFDLAQWSVASLWWSQSTDHVLVLAAQVIDDDLDRGHGLGRALGRRTTTARKLGQLGAQVVVDGLAEAHLDHAALVPGQSEPIVNADPDVHEPTDQPARPIRAPYTPAPGARRRIYVCGCRRVAARERHPARTGFDTHVTPLARLLSAAKH